MTPLLGFTPDADALTPGIMTACTNMVPFETGMQGAPSGITPSDVPVLASACIGAAVVKKLDGTRRLFTGTTTKLWELSAGVWVDISRATGYAGGSDSRWSFCQFGDTTVAADGQIIQRSVSTGAFADITGAPIAKIVFSVGAFVMALNLNDGAVKPDGWANCASFNDADWTPNVATLANAGRLVSTPGMITAGGRLGEYAIAYKEKAIYVGQFVGAPATFDWTEVPSGNAGCVGQDAWCDINGTHFVVGPDNIWLFDGTRPTPIGNGQIRQWFYNNHNTAYLYRTRCAYDAQNNRVWVFFCSPGVSTPDTALVYHILNKQWGRVTMDSQSVLNYVSSAVTINQLDSYAATIDALPGVPFDSQFWLTGGKSLAVFDASNQLLSLTGPSVTSSFETGDLGDDDQVTLLSQVRLRFSQNPSSASLTPKSKMNEGDGFVNGSASALTDGKFDTRQSGRFHRARFDLTGDYKVSAIRPKIVTLGTR